MDRPHANHRTRLRARYKQLGPDKMSDTDLAELALCYVLPRRDVRPLAAELIENHGGFLGLAELTESELSEISGVGDGVSVFVRLLAELARRAGAQRQNGAIICSTDSALRLLSSKFDGIDIEAVFELCLDQQWRAVRCLPVNLGPFPPSRLDASRLLLPAADAASSRVVLAHKRPNDQDFPASELRVIREIDMFLDSFNIELLDYYYFFRGEWVSALTAGILPRTPSRSTFLNPVFPGMGTSWAKRFNVLRLQDALDDDRDSE